MKKLLLTVFFFVALPFVSFAASGACSSHGGVSCAAGPDLDGSVICNDGWTNSSVSYASMVMCRSVEAISEPPKTSMPEPVKEETQVPVKIPVQELVPTPNPVVMPEPKKEVLVPVVVPVVSKPEVKKELLLTPILKKETKAVTPPPKLEVATTSETVPVIATQTKSSILKRMFLFFWK